METLLANTHPILWWLFATAAVSLAVTAIWRTWLGTVVYAMKDAVQSGVEIVALLREILPYIRDVKSCMEDIVSELRIASSVIKDHGEELKAHRDDIERIKQHVGMSRKVV